MEAPRSGFRSPSETQFGWAVKYPNEIVDNPIVTCEPDRINVKIRTSTANPSHIYAEDFHHSANCMTRNSNTLSILHNDCGMTQERMDNPPGIMHRICISVQIHPLFVTDSDRSYCAQCVYMDSNVVEGLEQNLSISEIAPSELEPQFDPGYSPQCVYSIRKGSFDGPEVHAAVVGETVFHVWQCSNENVGILVQNCNVEDLQGEKILIIDQRGCGVDQYLFKTPQYSSNLQTAFLESNVFKFVDKSMTRFRCQIRLCLKNKGNGCQGITPPNHCPSLDEFDQELVSSSPLLVEDITQSRSEPVLRSSTDQPRGPPGIKPPIGLSTAQVVNRGQPVAVVRSGYNYPSYPIRSKRATTVSTNATVPLKRPKRTISVQANMRKEEEVSEVDVVGLIRVLDNPEDLEYYAEQRNEKEFNEAKGQKCMASGLYWTLIGTIVLLFSVQGAVAFFIFRDRFALRKSILHRWN
ncbi:unnamed protein product [Bursaphelenchus xylophilus]|uniref:(pine wood nematode) hypothetical protein n=1 Tax=Bursaphelenchus xylophilus TaxID=6326 RepID=A0A7I8WQ51_BURXY|nr:unnamed protein product [Bursaphelenchus xylophilus]CAG9096199.1 unnamed protein product [Bursaphelenchus xylophilus]